MGGERGRVEPHGLLRFLRNAALLVQDELEKNATNNNAHCPNLATASAAWPKRPMVRLLIGRCCR